MLAGPGTRNSSLQNLNAPRHRQNACCLSSPADVAGRGNEAPEPVSSPGEGSGDHVHPGQLRGRQGARGV